MGLFDGIKKSKKSATEESVERKRILLVDDTWLGHISNALELADYDVEIEDSIRYAEGALSSESFDLILINFDNIEFEGIEYVEELHFAAPAIPILAIFVPEEMEMETLAAGASAVQGPDYEKNALIEAVRKLIGE